jgi:hypothetical protein
MPCQHRCRHRRPQPEAFTGPGLDLQLATTLLQALAHAAQAIAHIEHFRTDAIVAGLHHHPIGGFTVHPYPQMACTGVAHRVGDDLLGAAQQYVGPLRVFHVQRILDLQLDVQRGHVLGQRPQCGSQVDGAGLAQLADHLAHVAQQQLGQCVGTLHVLQRLALGQVTGHFQVQGQRSQLMPQEVVQLTRNARALVDPGTFGQQGAGRTQLGIQAALLLARLGLAAGHQRDHEHEAGEPHVSHRLQHSDGRRKAQWLDVDRQHGKVAGNQPDHADTRPQQPGQQAGHHHQQDAAQCGAGEIAHADRTGSQQDQRGMVEDAGTALAQRTGQYPVDNAEGEVGRGPGDDPETNVAIQVLQGQRGRVDQVDRKP